MAQAAEIAPRLLAALSSPPARPLAIRGASGSGKSRLLRDAVRHSGGAAVWTNAFDLVTQMTEAMRQNRYEHYLGVIADEARPVCIEHLEDLRGKPVTRGELRRLLEHRAARSRISVLTLTSASGDVEVLEWLAPWVELLVLD